MVTVINIDPLNIKGGTRTFLNKDGQRNYKYMEEMVYFTLIFHHAQKVNKYWLQLRQKYCWHRLEIFKKGTARTSWLICDRIHRHTYTSKFVFLVISELDVFLWNDWWAVCRSTLIYRTKRFNLRIEQMTYFTWNVNVTARIIHKQQNNYRIITEYWKIILVVYKF